MAEHRAIADEHGLKLIGYEAGQHFVGVAGGENHEALTRLLHAANAHPRLAEIYRKYYAAPGKGTLQGGGTAGGLGLDAEFFESVLVPQSLLYGFLGFHPRLDGCLIRPRLPAAWPSLTVALNVKSPICPAPGVQTRCRLSAS